MTSRWSLQKKEAVRLQKLTITLFEIGQMPHALVRPARHFSGNPLTKLAFAKKKIVNPRKRITQRFYDQRDCDGLHDLTCLQGHSGVATFSTHIYIKNDVTTRASLKHSTVSLFFEPGRLLGEV